MVPGAEEILAATTAANDTTARAYRLQLMAHRLDLVTGFDDLLALLVGLLTVAFELAVRIAAPLLCLMFLLTVGLGFIARTVPQVNILSVGFTLRILVGLAVLAVAFAAMGGVYVDVMKKMLRQLTMFCAY